MEHICVATNADALRSYAPKLPCATIIGEPEVGKFGEATDMMAASNENTARPLDHVKGVLSVTAGAVQVTAVSDVHVDVIQWFWPIQLVAVKSLILKLSPMIVTELPPVKPKLDATVEISGASSTKCNPPVTKMASLPSMAGLAIIPARPFSLASVANGCD